jgi:hypothetical protein
MDRRVSMQSVLDVEVERWSTKSAEEIIAELSREEQNYTIKADSTEYQLEVMLLENTDTYVHVSIAVDDGRLPYSIHPLSTTIIMRKRAS